MRHRQIDSTGPSPSCPRLNASGEANGRLRPPDDLDVPPCERARDAETECLADRLLARETSRVGLRGIRPRVAVRALGLGETPLAEARIAFERAADALDLDQVHTNGDHD